MKDAHPFELTKVWHFAQNRMREGSPKIRTAGRGAWVIAIVLVSATLAMIVSWRAPGLNLYVRDRLMQARGPTSPPDDIVIVAIDEASIARYGRFPWQRSLMTRLLDVLASAQPKAIAIDILYAEPMIEADDRGLAESIKRAGNAVVAAQLIETTDENGSAVVSWLRPLPTIENAAAGVGHVNVSTEADGAARELSLRKSDDQGQSLWSIGIETLRVGEGIRAASIRDTPGGLILGSRTIPIADDVPAVSFGRRDVNSRLEISRPDRMLIDYVGPPGSFSHQTYSFCDVLEGRVPPQSFRTKYILIGATAATLGDHVASPFVHIDGPTGEQHGELMPGVEVLANAMNTILRSRFYHEAPEWFAWLIAALVALAVVTFLGIAQGRFETVKQLGIFFGLLVIIGFLSYLAFVRWLFVPPLVPALLSFAAAAPLALLRRSLRTSADLDDRIAELTAANNLPFLSTGMKSGDDLRAGAATLIAHLIGAKSVAIYIRLEDSRRYSLIAGHGPGAAPLLAEDEIREAFSLRQISPDYSVTQAASPTTNDPSQTELQIELDGLTNTHRASAVLLGDRDQASGLLLIRDTQPHDMSYRTLRLCADIATSVIKSLADHGINKTELNRWQLPRGVEWKAKALGTVNRQLVARARFMDRALRAVEDGLIIADIGGRIAFTNPRAAEILDIPQRALLGTDLFQQLTEVHWKEISVEPRPYDLARELLGRCVVGRTPVEREIMVGNPQRYYMLRLSVVTSTDDETSPILGLVAALSDVTEQHELEEMKSDVMTLVSHELRTPLTAIQGMSEVLSQFEVPEERRREMHVAINDEAKRLANMITEYLDIAKLESGKRPLRYAPLRVRQLIERVLLLLEPLAAQRRIRIERLLMTELPVIMADADLIAQALTNLIANAIKYSPFDTRISVEASAHDDALLIRVVDHGYGIPADVLPHIFEKFYRVPRLEDADVGGTGLGLALVREIIELHGGQVAVESELGVGSSFSISIPLTVKGA